MPQRNCAAPSDPPWHTAPLHHYTIAPLHHYTIAGSEFVGKRSGGPGPRHQPAPVRGYLVRLLPVNIYKNKK